MTTPSPAARLARALAVTAAALSTGALAPASARAGELDVALGADASDSSWAEGAIGHGTLKVGYRFLRPWFQLTYLGKVGYADVDERVLTFLSLGAEVRPAVAGGRLRPYARASLVHQHEEPVVAIEHQPFQSLLGVGDGIRHRGGVAGALGLEVPLRPHRKGDWYASIELSATYFPDDRGPQRYVSAGAAVGVTWDFARSAAAPAGEEIADAR